MSENKMVTGGIEFGPAASGFVPTGSRATLVDPPAPTPADFARYDLAHPAGYDRLRTAAFLRELAALLEAKAIGFTDVEIVASGTLDATPSGSVRFRYVSQRMPTRG